jgi:septum formation inhibitor-activating ATPase MinD
MKDLETSLDTRLTTVIPEDQRVVRAAINKGMPFVISHSGCGSVHEHQPDDRRPGAD